LGPKKNPKRTRPKKNVKKVQSQGTGPTATTRAAAKIAAGLEDEAITLVEAPAAAVTMNNKAVVPTTNAAAVVQVPEGAASTQVHSINNRMHAGTIMRRTWRMPLLRRRTGRMPLLEC
jgi:hypothetical protein